MKKVIKILITLITFTVILGGFYYINSLNYLKNKEIKASFIEHPENLPTKETAVNTAFGFKNIKADFYWLEAIQYIGSNAVGSEYKKYLFSMIDIITELNPYFEHPYTIGELLIPSYNKRYENLSDKEQEKYIEQGEKLGLKGIKNFCDPKKIELIKQENNLIKIWSEEKYKNPCKSYDIPNYLAYIYFYYKNQPIEASNYYKISSAIDNGLEGSKIMAAIMAGKGGNREKSYFMFLNIAKTTNDESKICKSFSNELEKLGTEIFMKKSIPLNGVILEKVAKTRDELFGTFNQEKEDELLSDTECGNYLNKAIRELNIKYIENADKLYYEKYGKHSKNAKELYDKGFINYIPKDYQQYDDYSIIYEYNPETGFYDYVLGNYDD